MIDSSVAAVSIAGKQLPAALLAQPRKAIQSLGRWGGTDVADTIHRAPRDPPFDFLGDPALETRGVLARRSDGTPCMEVFIAIGGRGQTAWINSTAYTPIQR